MYFDHTIVIVSYCMHAFIDMTEPHTSVIREKADTNLNEDKEVSDKIQDMNGEVRKNIFDRLISY